MESGYLVDRILHYCNVAPRGCLRIQKRVIDYYDLTFVLKGTLTYVESGRTIVLKENDALLSAPGATQERLAGKEEVRYVSFNFTLRPGVTLSMPTFMPQVISREIRTMISVFSQSHLSPLYHSTEKAVNLLNYILFEMQDTLSMESNNETVSAIIKYIDSTLSSPVSLTKIAEHVHLSREYVAHIFKRETGKTVIEYANERKMLIAKDLILKDNLSLQQIALSLGFSNYSYFSKVFKKHFNTSPIRFKNS